MSNEEEEVRAVIEKYVTGFNRGDKALLMEVFHPRFVSSGLINGELQWDSAEEFADFCVEAAPDPEGPVPDWTIKSMNVSGATAVAVVHDQWGQRRFCDSLTLLNHQGRWQIVFKAFQGIT